MAEGTKTKRFLTQENGQCEREVKCKKNGRKTCDDKGYEPVYVESESQSQSQSQCGLCTPKIRKPVKICLIVSAVLLAVATAGVLLFFFLGHKGGSKSFSRSISSFNESTFSDLSLDYNTGSNSNCSNCTQDAAFGSVIPTVKAKPFWTTCQDGALADVHAVFTQACELNDDNRCLVKMGSAGVMEILFTPKQNFKEVRMDGCGSADLGGFESFCVSKRLKYYEACVDANLDCPLQAGKTYLYRANETVDISLPFSSNVNSYMRLMDTSTEEIIFCVVIPLRITTV